MNTARQDFELLREYVANRSETAFRELVERHVDMVYGTALRQVGDAHLAEEATQAVFIDLAKKARGLSSSTILAGWLFRAAQFAAAKVQRSELRRKHWEQQAAQMESNPPDSAAAWEQMAPQLNQALNELKEPDRDALIFRFIESKSMAQVGSALGITEGAAKMRVARALQQLRDIFEARGIALPVTLLAAALSTSATQAAPVGLAATITTSALLKSTTIPILTKGLLLLMNWNARHAAIAAIVFLSLTTVTSTTLLGVLLWKQHRPMHLARVSAPVLEREDFRGIGDDGGVTVEPGKDGLTVKTPDGDFVITNKNGENRFVTKDNQGRVKEVTITASDEGGGGQRMTVRSFRTGSGGPAGGSGTIRMRSRRGEGTADGGFGAGAGGLGGTAPGGEVEVHEDVRVEAPARPAKP